MSFSASKACGMLFALSIALLIPLAALAHTEVEVGSYIFDYGWVNEPVIVGQPNSLYLFIAPKEEGEHQEGETEEHTEGVTGAEATLEFTVEYGSARQSYDLQPVPGQPGLYRADLIPTRRGQYTFHFSGEINGEPVDLRVEPEEVEAAGRLAFPEPMLESVDIATQLEAAQAQANTTQAIAIASGVVALIGVGLGIYGMRRK